MVKVLAVMDDCIKYVLKQEFPAQIIDVNEYVTALSEETFDRNIISIETALTDLPDIYKKELANRLFTSYIHPQSTSILRSNIEFIAPILWKNLDKSTINQVVRRVDQEIQKGNSEITLLAFKFVELVKSQKYLSLIARRYRITPLIEDLINAQDDFGKENQSVKALVPYSNVIPEELMEDYIKYLTKTYVGRMGSSSQWSRTNFYADRASLLIPDMFSFFDDNATIHFIEVLKNDTSLQNRLNHAVKLERLRTLGDILLARVSDDFQDKPILEALSDRERKDDFFSAIR